MFGLVIIIWPKLFQAKDPLYSARFKSAILVTDKICPKNIISPVIVFLLSLYRYFNQYRIHPFESA